jgi:hypothetical protein
MLWVCFFSIPAAENLKKRTDKLILLAKTSRRYLYRHNIPAIRELYDIINILNGEKDETSDGWQPWETTE